MDHLGISNIVDRRGAFRVAGVATADVSFCSGLGVWYGKMQLRKVATKIFDLPVLILGVSLNVYLLLQKVRMSFSIHKVKVCSLLYNLLYQFSQFPVSMEHFKRRKQKMAELLLMDHHKAPCMDRWAIHGTVHSVTDCKYFTKFSICYLNVNVSRPVFGFSSIITCN